MNNVRIAHGLPRALTVISILIVSLVSCSLMDPSDKAPDGATPISDAIDLRLRIEGLRSAPPIPKPHRVLHSEAPAVVRAFDSAHFAPFGLENDRGEIAVISGFSSVPESTGAFTEVAKLVNDGFSIHLRNNKFDIAESDYEFLGDLERTRAIRPAAERERFVTSDEKSQWEQNLPKSVKWILILHADPLSGAESGMRRIQWSESMRFHETEWQEYVTERAAYLKWVQEHNVAVDRYVEECKRLSRTLLEELKRDGKSASEFALDFSNLSDRARESHIEEILRARIENWLQPDQGDAGPRNFRAPDTENRSTERAAEAAGNSLIGNPRSPDAGSALGSAIQAWFSEENRVRSEQAYREALIDQEVESGLGAEARRMGSGSRDAVKKVVVRSSELPASQEECITYWQIENEVGPFQFPGGRDLPPATGIASLLGGAYAGAPLEMTVSGRLLDCQRNANVWSGIVTVRAPTLAEVVATAGKVMTEMMISKESESFGEIGVLRR